MDTCTYFMLLTDTPQARTLDKNVRNQAPSITLVERGSLWKSASLDRTDSYTLSTGPASSGSQMTVFSCEHEGMRLTCPASDLERLTYTEFLLLLAVSSKPLRYRVAVDRAWDFKDIARVCHRWMETTSSAKNLSHRTGTMEDVYVYLLGQKGLPERAVGRVQYIGSLPSAVGLWFGIALAPRYEGQGTTNGVFKGKQIFQSADDSAIFVAVNKIALCRDAAEFEDPYDAVEHRGKTAQSVTRVGTVGGGQRRSAEILGEDLPHPPLELNERIVWISDNGPELGTVRWIGILPDARIKEYTVGVEFDNAIGTGTGKYNNEQLFRTVQGHASLVPILGLMKAEEFYGSTDCVPPAPIAGTGQGTVQSYRLSYRAARNNATVTGTTSNGGSRRETPSPHTVIRAKLGEDTPDGRQSATPRNQFTEPVSSVTSSQEDVHSRVSTVSGGVESYTTGGARCVNKITTVQLKSPASGGSSSSSLRGSIRDGSSRENGGRGGKSAAPPPPQKSQAESSRSIYDRDPEHCYENVEKDAETGRLLNRDTRAFCLNENVSSPTEICSSESTSNRFPGVRSSSGEDVSLVHGSRTTGGGGGGGAGTAGSRSVPPTLAVIHRSSRSVDNIFTDEIGGSQPDHYSTQSQTVVLRGAAPFRPGAPANIVAAVTTQVPYHTGRSTFYERVDGSSASADIPDSMERAKSTHTSSSLGHVTSSNKDASARRNNNTCVTTSRTAIKEEEPLTTATGGPLFVSPQGSPQKNSSLLERYDTHRVVSGHESRSFDVSSENNQQQHVNGRSACRSGANESISPKHNQSNGESIRSPPNLSPKTLTAKELGSDLEIGSVVELEVNGFLHYGVLRWIGWLNDRSRPFAGVELEEELESACDGRLGRTRLFHCAPHKALFVSLASVRRDERFTESSTFVHRKESQIFGSIECLDITGCLSPLSFDDAIMIGENRGIQGHHNSCYMDSTLFSMFAFSTAFDSLLYRPKTLEDIERYEEVRAALRDGIVNPLRKNFYVRADKVLRLRTLLDQSSSVEGLMGEEKDPEEFVNSLLQQTLKTDPFIKLSSGQESYMYQLFMDKDEKVTLPTTQQLLELSFFQSDVKLSEVPSCLILQMPRFGKDYRLYRRIIPSLYLDITDILQTSLRECAICGLLATHECKDCYKHFGDSLDRVVFCDLCLQKSHSHLKRSGHRPNKINTNEDYVKRTAAARGSSFAVGPDHGLEGRGPEKHGPEGWSLDRLREHMELFAVICIQTSHYVSFVKTGTAPDSPWVFFDSMADRKGEQHGYNVPRVDHCPFLPTLLLNDNLSTIHRYHDDKDLPDQMRRLLCDAYICMYQSCALQPYR